MRSGRKKAVFFKTQGSFGTLLNTKFDKKLLYLVKRRPEKEGKNCQLLLNTKFDKKLLLLVITRPEKEAKDVKECASKCDEDPTLEIVQS